MTAEELKALQSLPAQVKVRWAKEKIQEWYEHWNGQVYVAFSGGKDSTVLLHIVRQLYPEVPAVFVDTGLEFPEIREFVRTIDDVVWLKPKMPFTEVLKKYGYPVVSKEQAQFISELKTTNSEKLRKTRIEGNSAGRGKVAKKWMYLVDSPFKVSHKCCDVMKKEPSKRYEKETGRHPFLGTMAEDSQLRRQKYLREGCNAFQTKRPMSTPLAVWTEQDVWACLRAGVAYCKIYDMGEDRTGCIFCMFGCHKDSPNRFQRLSTSHPKLHEYCMTQLGLKEVLKFMGLPTGLENKISKALDTQDNLE